MREDIYIDDILHYDAVIEELYERTGLSREICETVYNVVADIMMELGIMEAAGGNNDCSGLGYDECNTCEMQCPYR